MARPRSTKPKDKKEGFSPDSRLDAPALPPAPVKSHTEPDAIVSATPVCPRAGVCLHAGDCRQEPDGCGAFTRQYALTPAAREAEKVRAHREAVHILEGNEVPANLRSHANLAAAMQEARQARLDREGPTRLYGDPRSYYPRNRGGRW
jgi:hypothetical protein